MCCASDTLDPLALEPRIAEQRIADRGIADLRYYNGDIHRALFALPNFFRELVPARSADRAAQALAHAVR
jgi:spermidine synthase